MLKSLYCTCIKHKTSLRWYQETPDMIKVKGQISLLVKSLTLICHFMYCMASCFATGQQVQIHFLSTLQECNRKIAQSNISIGTKWVMWLNVSLFWNITVFTVHAITWKYPNFKSVWMEGQKIFKCIQISVNSYGSWL